MPEVRFAIDAASGALEFEVRGVAGPACDDVARLAKALLGEPAREQATAEYHLRPHVRPRTRPGRGT